MKLKMLQLLILTLVFNSYIESYRLEIRSGTNLTNLFDANDYPCLDQVSLCENGFSLSVNLTLISLNRNRLSDRLVLVSSGGDSDYANGFYLHQVNINKDEYLEFGVSSKTRKWITKLRVSPNYQMNVFFTWDSLNGINSYIDGIFHMNVPIDIIRDYIDLRFDPERDVVILESRPNQTMVSGVVFYDSVSEGKTVEIPLSSAAALQGCIQSGTIKGLIDYSDSVTSQCKSYCYSNSYQVFLVQAKKCSCIDSIASAFSQMRQSCDSADITWSVYVSSHLVFNQSNKIGLSIEGPKSLQIDAGNPVVVKVAVSVKNTLTMVDFGDGVIKALINDGVVFYEYINPGSKIIKLTSTNLERRELIETSELKIEIIPKQNGKPVESAELIIKGVNGLKIDAYLEASGGLPYDCVVNYGNKEQNSFTATTRTSKFDISYVYPVVGLYNVSVVCTSGAIKGSISSDWALVYVPDTQLTSRKLYLVKENLPSKLNLDLPVKYITSNFNFFINDATNSVSKQSWTSSSSGLQQTNYQVPFSTDNLKNTDNIIVISSNGINLVTYTISIEETLTVNPQVTLVNPPKPNEPVIFRVLIVPKLRNNILRVNYGDGNVVVYSLGSQSAENFELFVNHTYLKTQPSEAQFILANQISSRKSIVSVVFERELGDFVLVALSNATELNEDVVFTLSTVDKTFGVSADQIVFGNNTIIASNYVFNNENSFSLTFKLRFTSYGYLQPKITIYNSVSMKSASAIVKVGSDLTRIHSYLMNNYVYLGDLVQLYLEIETGNGYDIKIEYSKDELVTIPWNYVENSKNNGKSLGEVISRQLVYPTYKYQKVGVYSIKIEVKNAFGSVSIDVCGLVRVLPQPSNQVDCFKNNLDIISIDAKEEDGIIQVSKGLNTTLQVTLDKCIKQNFSFIWSLTKLVDGTQFSRSVRDYCNKQSSRNQFLIVENTLEFGLYSLSASIFSNSTGVFKQILNKPILIISSPLVASLAGPDELQFNDGEEYIIDFYSGSYDPDQVDGSKSQLQFVLACLIPNKNDSSVILKDELIVKREFDLTKAGYELILNETLVKFYQRNCLLEPSVFFNDTSYEISVNTSVLDLSSSESQIYELIVYDENRYSIDKQRIKIISLAKPSSDLNEMAKQLNKLDDLASKDPKGALKFVSGFADALNNIGESSESTMTTTAANSVNLDDKMSGLRGKMLGTMDKIVDGVGDPDSIATAAGATSSVTSNSEQMPMSNQDSSSAVLEKMGEKSKGFKAMSQDTMSNLGNSVLGAGGNIFDAAVKTVPAVENNVTADFNETEPEPIVLPKKIEAPLEFYHNCDDCEDFPEDRFKSLMAEEAEKERQANEVRKQTASNAKKSTGGISGVATALTSCNGSASLEQKGLALVATKVSNESNGASLGSSSGTKISMPKLKNVLNDSQQGLPEVSTKLIVADKNPYQSVGSKSTINSPIVTLQLADDDGNELLINNTKEPFVINIPSKGPIETISSFVKLLEITYHKTFVPNNDSALSLILTPLTKGDYYHVYISHSPKKTIAEYPNEKSHDWVFTVPNNLTYDESTEEGRDFKHTIFLSNNETKGEGYYFIGVKLVRLSNDTKTQIPINSTVYSDYELRLFTSSCKYWSEKHNEWRTEGCYVGRGTTFKATECLCYHLTTFGSDMVVPPNTIDFSNVWSKFDLTNNAGVFSTIVTLFGLYIIVAIWARYMDKKDIIKWGATPLKDNLPTDEYYYLVSVQTGVGREAGTQSNVGFVLSGENADSGVRKLSDGKRKGFSSGSQSNFICSVDEKLGPLTYLRIWHDNSGKGAQKSWYLNMVNVIDLQTNDKYSFVCEKWFAVERGDGQIDRVLPAASKKDLTQFSHLFTKSIKKKFTDGHLWFSVFSRPTKSRFTRLQRISCAMSLLFCSMIANAMFYKAEDKTKASASAINIGPITFTMSQLFTSVVSTLIIVPVNVIIVTIFRKAKHKNPKIMPSKAFVAKQQYWRRTKAEEKSLLQRVMCCFKKEEKDTEYKRDIHEEAQKKDGRNLPYWFIYIAWILCFIAMVVPAFFCILYSMEWGRDRSNAWLTSIALSFFQGNLVVDPLKVFVITAIITFILRKVDDDDFDSLIDSGDPIYNAIANHDEEFLKQSTSSLSQVDIQKALKSRKTKLTKLKTLSAQELEEQRALRLKEIKMNEILREMASYLFFLIVLLFLCHQSRDPNSYNMHNQMTQAFVENPIMSFEDIKSRPDFWTYVEEVFLPQMYAPSWYNGQKINWREKLMLMNRYSIRVGAPRIRQLRVKNPSCKVYPSFKSIVPGCRNDYNWVDDDTKDYEEGWVLVDKNQTAILNDEETEKVKCNHSWCYQNTLQTKGVPITGIFTTYKGGGYVATLGKTLNRSLTVLEGLKENGWVDQQTRALFFEFTVYNPNVNLFSSATLIVEYLSTGSAVTYVSMSVFRLYNYVGSFAIVVIFFQVLFICFLIYFIVNEVLQIKKQGKKYFKQFWNINEMIMIVFSIISIAMYVMKNTFTTLAMKIIRESEANAFVNFGTIALWDDTFSSILAMVAFCATLKFMKLLRFNKRIGMLAETLKFASADLKSFCLTLLFVLFAYAQFGYSLFGNALGGYKSFMSSITSVFLMVLGQFDLNEFLSVHQFLGMFYFATFVFFVVIGMMTIFMTILGDAFTQVKEDMANRENDYEFFDFMFQRMKKINVISKFKLRKKKVEKEESTDDKEEEQDD